MALSYLFKQSIRRETRWQRRRTVLWFLGMCLAVVLTPIVCGRQAHAGLRETVVCAAVIATASAVASTKSRTRKIYLTSLDDRAWLRYGVLFDALTADQQQRLLATYRVGTYVWTPPAAADPAQTQGAVNTWRIRLVAILVVATVAGLMRWAESQGHVPYLHDLWVPLLLAAGLAAWVSPNIAEKWISADDPPVRPPDWA